MPAPRLRRSCRSIQARTLQSWRPADCRTCHPTPARAALGVRLKLTEIFHSLQGEADTVGIPTTFVRLTGCPLRCQYCDTAYAFHGGEWWELSAILDRVRQLGTRHVCVT